MSTFATCGIRGLKVYILANSQPSLTSEATPSHHIYVTENSSCSRFEFAYTNHMIWLPQHICTYGAVDRRRKQTASGWKPTNYLCDNLGFFIWNGWDLFWDGDVRNTQHGPVYEKLSTIDLHKSHGYTSRSLRRVNISIKHRTKWACFFPATSARDPAKCPNNTMSDCDTTVQILKYSKAASSVTCWVFFAFANSTAFRHSTDSFSLHAAF